MKKLLILLLIFGFVFAQSSSEIVSPSDGISYMFKQFGRGIHVLITDITGDYSEQVQARLEIQRELYLEMEKEQRLGNIEKVMDLQEDDEKLQSQIQARVQKAVVNGDTEQMNRMLIQVQNHEQIMNQQQNQNSSIQISSQERLKEMLNTSTQNQQGKVS